MKSRCVNLPKEKGYGLHLETGTKQEEQPVVQKQRLDDDDAETLNKIHHHMLSKGVMKRFQQLQEKVKHLSHPNILQCFTDFRDKTSWIEPINIGSGELWEKFQQDGELW